MEPLWSLDPRGMTLHGYFLGSGMMERPFGQAADGLYGNWILAKGQGLMASDFPLPNGFALPDGFAFPNGFANRSFYML